MIEQLNFQMLKFEFRYLCDRIQDPGGMYAASATAASQQTAAYAAYANAFQAQPVSQGFDN